MRFHFREFPRDATCRSCGALARNLHLQNPEWFSYKISEPEPRAFIGEPLSREIGLVFEPEDIALTQGAFAAISLADLLDSASNRIGARTWLLLDEPYRRIRFDNAPFHESRLDLPIDADRLQLR